LIFERKGEGRRQKGKVKREKLRLATEIADIAEKMQKAKWQILYPAKAQRREEKREKRMFGTTKDTKGTKKGF